ncbi:MAG: hypothetical protein RJS97_20900 [Parvibaculaceae bacterium]
MRSKIAWLCAALVLVLVWLFRGNGFYQIASIMFFTNGTYLVGPPSEFDDFCEQYAGAEIFRTVKDVEGTAYFRGVSLYARDNELSKPPIAITSELLATGSSDGRDMRLFGATYTSIRLLLESYRYVESYAEPRTTIPSFVAESGLYRFSRLELPENLAECSDVEKEYIFPARENAVSFRAKGLLSQDFCVKAEPIGGTNARFEYLETHRAYKFFHYETLISNGTIDLTRSIARNRVTDEVLAVGASFHWSDSVGGGSRDGGRSCYGDRRFPRPQDVLLPLQRAASN